MTKLYACLLAGVLLSCGSTGGSKSYTKNASSETAASQAAKNLVGKWKNQLGSTLDITTQDATTGQIAGTYQSPSGTAGQKFPLIGWVNEAKPAVGKDHATTVAFTVRWGLHGSITSWTGICITVDGLEQLQMQWHLARSNSDFTWDHIITNKDVFVR